MKKIDGKIFWKEIKELLDNNSLTQKDLSNKTGISINTIETQIQRGTVPKLEQALAIVEALNVSIEYVVGLTRGNDPSFVSKQNLKAWIDRHSDVELGNMFMNIQPLLSILETIKDIKYENINNIDLKSFMKIFNLNEEKK